MKKLIALIFCGTSLFCSVALANSTTVNWGAQIDNGVGDASGNPLANGSNDLILLGSFNINNATIIANGSNLSFLMSHFITFGSQVIGAGNPNGAGSASDGYWTGVTTASASGLSIQNTEVYYWVFNAPTAGAATQQGIFTVASNTNWTFPDDTSIAQSLTNDLDEVPHDASGILWGSFGTGTSRDGMSPLYNLALIPEPSIYINTLLGFGLLGCAGLRRRFKK